MGIDSLVLNKSKNTKIFALLFFLVMTIILCGTIYSKGVILDSYTILIFLGFILTFWNFIHAIIEPFIIIDKISSTTSILGVFFKRNQIVFDDLRLKKNKKGDITQLDFFKGGKKQLKVSTYYLDIDDYFKLRELEI